MKQTLRALTALLLCVLVLTGGIPLPAAFAASDASAETDAEPYYLSGSESVYITATGKRYHRTDSCGNTQEAHLVSLEEACRLGYTPCGRCHPTPCPAPDESFAFPEGSVIVCISIGDKCYHSTPDCCNMKNPVAVTLEEAKYLGRNACEKCDPPE